MKSLGGGVLRWFKDYLPSPADRTKPFICSRDQARFVLEWYRVDDEGVFVWRRGIIQEPKGWGKSPFGAALALAEFAGPVRFGGWRPDGSPIGVPWGEDGNPPPWVQIAACAQEQAFSNTYSVVWALLEENEGAAAAALNIDSGKTRVDLKGMPGAKLEAVTSSWGAREGQRLTFGLLEETQNWLRNNGGQKLARTMRRNAAKMDGRTLELGNAHELGEGSVAEGTCEANAPGVLVWAPRPTREPDILMDDAELADLLAEVYGDAPWIDQSRILRDVRDPENPWDEVSRFFFNLPTASNEVAINPVTWAARADHERALVEGETIGLGFDGSETGDSTSLIGCTRDGFVFEVAVWERPEGSTGETWTVDRDEVDRVISYVFATYDVAFLYADPWWWRGELDEWAARYPDRIVHFDTGSSRRMAPAVDRFRADVASGRVTHDGATTLTRHVLNARLRKVGNNDDGRPAYVITKPSRSRKIDACTAAVLARRAAAQIGDDEEIEPLAALA